MKRTKINKRRPDLAHLRKETIMMCADRKPVKVKFLCFQYRVKLSFGPFEN